MRRELKNNNLTQSTGEIRRIEDSIRNAPYQWISEIEEILIRAFVDDETLRQRARTRIAVRGIPSKPVMISLPRNQRGKLNVANLGESVATLGKVADRPLDTDEEAAAQAKANFWISNRDLLAHRLGRESATHKWKSCPSDAYNLGGNAYRRRLAVAGRALSSLGGPPEPDQHPWRPRIAQDQLPGKSMEERQRDAERLAEEAIG